MVPLVRCMMIAFGALIHRLIWGMARLGLLVLTPPTPPAPAFAFPASPPSVRFSSMYWAKYLRRVNFSWREAGTWLLLMLVRLLPSPNWTYLDTEIVSESLERVGDVTFCQQSN